MRGVRSEPDDRVTQELVRELFDYDPLTGHLTRWTSGKSGGRQPTILGRRYLSSHVIWLFCHGRWPAPGMEIDHRDRDKGNESLSNLREVTHSQNQMNRRAARGKASGYKGVKRKHGFWYAYVIKDGQGIEGGRFKAEEEAAREHDRLARIHHGEFAVLNFDS